MKYRVSYSLKPMMSARDLDNYSHGKYQCHVLLQTRKGQPVVISQHKDTGVWMVGHGFSTIFFSTKAEALAYCKGRFLDLGGQPLRHKRDE